MDNTTILFNAIQRVYRNTLVEFIRERMTVRFDAPAPGSVHASVRECSAMQLPSESSTSARKPCGPIE